MTENITVNEQNSIRIAAGCVIYIDPLNIQDSPHDADIILITHDHYDHFSEKDIDKVSKPDTLFAAPVSMKENFGKSGIPDERITFLKPGESSEICGVSVKAVPAYNRMKPFHPKKNGWLGYVLTVSDSVIYVCGDTDDLPENRNIKCDILCVPIGGTFTMDAKQAAEFTNAVKPKSVIPVHYGTLVGKPSDAEKFIGHLTCGSEVCLKLNFDK